MFSEFFQIFFRFFFRNFWKFLNLEIFCCQPMKNVGKLAVLLLFSRFSASFFFTFCSSQVPKVEENELFCCYFQTFALVFPNFEKFQTFFRKFSEIFQIFSDFFQKKFRKKFLKKIWKKSEKSGMVYIHIFFRNLIHK